MLVEFWMDGKQYASRSGKDMPCTPCVGDDVYLKGGTTESYRVTRRIIDCGSSNPLDWGVICCICPTDEVCDG